MTESETSEIEEWFFLERMEGNCESALSLLRQLCPFDCFQNQRKPAKQKQFSFSNMATAVTTEPSIN